MLLADIPTDALIEEIESRGCRVIEPLSDQELDARLALNAWRRRVLVGYRYPTPSGRVAAILHRLSRERVLSFDQYTNAVYTASRRHSRAWSQTANAFTQTCPRNKFYGFYRGRLMCGPAESYAGLVAEARRDNCPFMSIDEYRRKQLQRAETLCERNRAVLNIIKKEIKHVSKNRNGRPASPIPGEHVDRRENRRHQAAGSITNAEARGAD